MCSINTHSFERKKRFLRTHRSLFSLENSPLRPVFCPSTEKVSHFHGPLCRDSGMDDLQVIYRWRGPPRGSGSQSEAAHIRPEFRPPRNGGPGGQARRLGGVGLLREVVKEPGWRPGAAQEAELSVLDLIPPSYRIARLSRWAAVSSGSISGKGVYTTKLSGGPSRRGACKHLPTSGDRSSGSEAHPAVSESCINASDYLRGDFGSAATGQMVDGK